MQLEPVEYSTNPAGNSPLATVHAAQKHEGMATQPMDHEFMDDENVLGRCNIGLDNGTDE